MSESSVYHLDKSSHFSSSRIRIAIKNGVVYDSSMSNKYIIFLFPFFLALNANSSEIENQCLQEAKSVALKTYDICLSEKKSEQIEQLKNEYQARALQLKNDYENRIHRLSDNSKTSDGTNEDFEPTTAPYSEAISEPTVVLKPAQKNVIKKSNTSVKSALKSKEQNFKKNVKISNLKPKKIIQKAEVNEITGQIENLEMTDPSLGQE
ncbi:MAG: hypothetical protein ACK5V3_09090 [Bdellovibrionales bacterium]